MPDPIFLGVDGLPVRLVLLNEGVLVDPAGATLLNVTIRQPDGAILERTQATDPPVTIGSTSGLMPGENGTPRVCLEYVMPRGELPTDGTYKIQGYLRNAAGGWPTSIVKLKLKDSILELSEDE